MPEGPELRIMSDYINQNCSDKVFTNIFHVEKGNNPIDSKIINNFRVEAKSNGKELKLRVYHDIADLYFSIFMGMSGNWKFVPTDTWNSTKFVRLRLDTTDGYSLLLYGAYMGPKYKLGNFSGAKRGPDSTKDFDSFRTNILSNLHLKVFDKPICEVLLDQKYFNGIGAYLCSEIVGRLDINPFENSRKFLKDSNDLINMCRDASIESYKLGGGELMDWKNPFGESKISEWIRYYGNKDICYKQKFGKRNIWIQKKFIKSAK